MAALERVAKAPSGFVPASSGPEGGNRQSAVEQPAAPSNPDAIDVEDDL